MRGGWRGHQVRLLNRLSRCVAGCCQGGAGNDAGGVRSSAGRHPAAFQRRRSPCRRFPYRRCRRSVSIPSLIHAVGFDALAATPQRFDAHASHPDGPDGLGSQGDPAPCPAAEPANRSHAYGVDAICSRPCMLPRRAAAGRPGRDLAPGPDPSAEAQAPRASSGSSGSSGSPGPAGARYDIRLRRRRAPADAGSNSGRASTASAAGTGRAAPEARSEPDREPARTSCHRPSFAVSCPASKAACHRWRRDRTRCWCCGPGSDSSTPTAAGRSRGSCM